MIRAPLIPAAALGLAALLGGCSTLRTPYVQPQVALQPQWAHARSADRTPQGDAWWRRFGDPSLDRLVDRVLTRDNDLAVAAIALRRAQLQARYAVINPTIGASDSYSYNAPLKGPLPATRLNSGVLQASYEVDLFGALAAEKDVARWEARATAQDLASTRLSLIGTAVDDYFQVAYLNERIALGQESVSYAGRTLDLVKIQARAGSASSLEVAESTQNLESQQASLRTLTQQRVEARAALNLLLDGDTAAPADELTTLPQGDPPPHRSRRATSTPPRPSICRPP